MSSTQFVHRRILTKNEAPEGTLIGVFGDSHIGIHDARAMRLMVECMDAVGVDILIPNGDIHDCGPVSPHAKKTRLAAISNGSLLEEARKGREFINWMCTRRLTLMGEGNHEDWINDVAVRTNTVGSLSVTSALNLPVSPSFEVLPHGYQIRLGSLVIEHGDILFGRGGGGKNLARQILERCPDQTTIVGHFHRADFAVRTSPDAKGSLRSHAAYAVGHLSLPEAHTEYAGRYPVWQQSFLLVKVYYIDSKPRFTIHNVEIHRDRRNRPFFEYAGRIYR